MSATKLLILISISAMARNIDPNEVLRYFSSTVFALIAVVYTGFVFWQELAKNGPFIFSRKNARTKLNVLLAHATFLMVLLYGYRISTDVIPRLPYWMTDTFRIRYSTRVSFADILVISMALGIAYFERRWLYRERQIPLAQENSLSKAPTTDDQ